jgi:hypothetical protein
MRRPDAIVGMSREVCAHLLAQHARTCTTFDGEPILLGCSCGRTIGAACGGCREVLLIGVDRESGGCEHSDLCRIEGLQ